MILSSTKLEHQEYVTILPATTTIQAIGLLSSSVLSDQQDTGVTLLTQREENECNVTLRKVIDTSLDPSHCARLRQKLCVATTAIRATVHLVVAIHGDVSQGRSFKYV